MRISTILEDLSESGCDDFFSESVTSLPLEESEIRSLSKVVESFSKMFLETAGFVVETSVSEDDSGLIVVENRLKTKNGIDLGSVQHSIHQTNRTEIHFVEESSGINSAEFVETFRKKGNRIVRRFLPQ